ncbi:MAG: ornithine cyclodeaminase family protein [Cytophagales bacterium]|nr:ornithine cyclodeaminase family protein [Cytophagales bacterium]
MIYITREEILKSLDYPSLIEKLREAFRIGCTVPARHHHEYENPEEGIDSTLLLMPSWEAGKHLGVKVVTVSPNNGRYGLPAIQGFYLLFDAHKGKPAAILEAKTLTARRTAAASALASSYLSRKDASSLLMVGTGALAPELVRAHLAVRSLRTVKIWGRSSDKAAELSKKLQGEFPDVQITKARNLREEVPKASIVSCATLSKTPLVKGEWLRGGQHLDLVGAYRPDMCECDSRAVIRSRVYVDTIGGTREGGDLAIPLQKGVIDMGHVCGDLYSLTRGQTSGRSFAGDITLFKSVGHALEDLAAAQLVAERQLNNHNLVLQ